MHAQHVLDFWFKQLKPEQWFSQDSELDQQIRQQFGQLYQQAVAGELFAWRKDAEGRLAEIIILDQFSRNIFRQQAAAFAADPIALVLAQEAIAQNADQTLSSQQRAFLYMPFMHSESLKIQQIALELFTQLGNSENLKFAKLHKDIIERFGRYPHRNQVLGRVSTPEELNFLQQPNSSF
ncbi:DUF924 family protein [Alkanindiges sp. WGS2144]|uniref:DUF924 family protein n=1 Tax=Alkanindiges sp. WGS2144 TaxID=3366808 RepID=UPI003751DD2F